MARVGLVLIGDPINFIIGDTQANTPQADAVDYDNPALKGAKYLVHQNYRGFLHEGIHWKKKYGGGLKLLAGEKFAAGTEWSVIPI